MNQKYLKKIELLKRVITYALMASSVLVFVAIVTLFMLGYRIDIKSGDVHQYAFLQYNSSPSGATITVDDKIIGSKTPSKSSLAAGKHEVKMWRDGYRVWKKTVDTKAGTITWLNYALLIPKELSVEPVKKFNSIYKTFASPDGNDFLIQENSKTPTFALVDLSSDNVESAKLSIQKSIYSESNITNIVHDFEVKKWDESGRYVLIKHIYDKNSEWLVLDTQNVNLTKNITKIFDIQISDVEFADNSGEKFYALSSGDVRILDLSTETISKPLIKGVISFNINNKTKVLTYIANDLERKNNRVVGVYQEGDNDAPIVRNKIEQNKNLLLNIQTTKYFNDNYVAISLGKKVDILSGSYPNVNSDNSPMKVIASLEVLWNIDKITFSPTGKYLFIQAGSNFASYDLENKKLSSSSIEGVGNKFTIKWLDNNHIWSDRNKTLTIREFDGGNINIINNVLLDQDVVLTSNGKYIYSVGKTNTGYQLQRVQMIL